MDEPFIVEGHFGKVELEGKGPWSVHEMGRSSYTIIDSNLRPARPRVWRALPGGSGNGTKADSNVVWAAKSVPNVIVDAANEAWAKAQA